MDAAKYVCAKSHEGCQRKSPIIRPAKNKKGDFRCDTNRKQVKLSYDVKKYRQ